MFEELWRTGRGVAVGMAILLTSAVAHLCAGGVTVLETPRLLLLGFLAVAVGIRLSAREWTLPRLIALLGIAQVVIHVVLQVPLTSAATNGGSHRSLLDSVTGGTDSMVMPMSMPMGDGSGSHSPTSMGAMVLCHALAVVVIALLLRRGEAWLVRLRQLLSRALGFVFASPSVPALPPLPKRPQSAFTLSVHSHLGTLAQARRGPPVLICSAM